MEPPFARLGLFLAIWGPLLCVVVGSVSLACGCFQAQERGGPFIATVATILMTYAFTITLWWAWRYVPEGVPLNQALFVYTITRMWFDLFTRFPPGVRRAS